jgi:hypothetical protein
MTTATTNPIPSELLIPATLPDGVEVRHVMLTPELATELLSRNLGNRPLSDPRAKGYSRQMIIGGWHFTGDPIHVSDEGILLNGQHRVRAVQLGAPSVLVTLITGLSAQAQAYMDVGRARMASHIIAMQGAKHAKVIAASGAVLMKWNYPYCERVTEALTPTSPEVAEFFAHHRDLERSAELANQAYHAGRFIKPSVAAALHYATKQVCPYRADEFLFRLRTGEGLPELNPLLVLRNKLIMQASGQTRRGRVERNEQLYLMVQAWNKWMTRTATESIQLPRGGINPNTSFAFIRDNILPDDEWTPKEA